MRSSLTLRVFIVIGLINAALFAAGGFILRDRFASADDRVVEALLGQMDAVGYAVSGNIRPRGDLNVARILRWEGWSIADDAILVDSHLRRLGDGSIVTDGVELNPRGRSHRPATFDRQAVLGSLLEAMTTRTPQAVAAGRSVAIEVPGGAGEVWGACWFRVEPSLDLTRLFQSILPLFLVSTLLLTAGTFVVLRWVVLEPVGQLADGAQRVQGGDFSVRIAESGRRDELAQLVHTFNEMTSTVGGFNKRLESEVEKATHMARRAEAEAMTQRRLAAMGELAAGIAHEINNPLGGLQNAVERLERDDLPEPKRSQYFELLRGGLERIGTTVGRLLRFTPRHSGTAPVDLCDVASDAMALVQHRADREGVRLAFLVGGTEVDPEHAGGSLPPVTGLRHELSQAVLNLLVNALDALEEKPPEAPRIEVEVALEDGGLSLSVRDNGPGVPARDLARLADLFFTTKEVGRGSGLGLSIVHNVVSSHGGRVSLANLEPHGLGVSMHLPRADAQAPAERSPH